jgi:hypothetical protein
MEDTLRDIDGVLDRLDAVAADVASNGSIDAKAASAELLDLSEFVLERWVEARDMTPTRDKSEGFRLLALHRQGAKGEPSFNACRETCREIVYQHNVVAAAGQPERALVALGLQVMVLRHLALFIAGKLQVAGLGEFCCASKPLRAGGDGKPEKTDNMQGALT